MLRTNHRPKQAVSQIVQEYRILVGRSHRPATLRAFAGSLSEALRAAGHAVSYQSIKNWSDRRYLPDTLLMMRLAKLAHDWRADFATDILAALHPDDYQPASEIGRRALRNSHELILSGGTNGNHSSAHANGS